MRDRHRQGGPRRRLTRLVGFGHGAVQREGALHAVGPEALMVLELRPPLLVGREVATRVELEQGPVLRG